MFILNVAMCCLLSLYHIETQRLKNSEIYYLTKTIRINGKVLNIREKIGKTRPTRAEENMLKSKPNLSLEIKALDKKIENKVKTYEIKYLHTDDVFRLEKTKYWDYMFSMFLTASENEHFRVNSEIEYVHGTTAIEGNTFSLQQVDELLQLGVHPSTKSLREINEVQNYAMVEKYRESYTGKVTIPSSVDSMRSYWIRLTLRPRVGLEG